MANRDRCDGRKAILIAEEDVEMRRESTAALCREGHDSVDRDAVLGYLKSGRAFSAIVLDGHISGGVDAVDTVREIRRIVPLLPVIVMLGTEPRASCELMRSGATDVVSKPVSGEDARNTGRPLLIPKGDQRQ